MAKLQPKKAAKTSAKTKTAAKKSDPLAISLRLLSRADQESREAIRHLCKAVLLRVELPKLVSCKFKLKRKPYHAKVFAEHAVTIMKAVDDGGNVEAAVNNLLSEMTSQIVGDINGFRDEFAVTPALHKTRGTAPVALGCCTYIGGQTPNLTQTQCAQFAGSSWNSLDPTCST
ncbi:MAG: hypothetical protein ACYC61_08555 [Isosphaeraceae bacterium]